MPRARKYPPEPPDRGARLALESGRSTAHVAKDIGVPSETLRKHFRRLEVNPGLRADQPSVELHQQPFDNVSA